MRGAGRYPAAEAHARKTPPTAASVARQARTRYPGPTRLNATRAAAGRNQATGQVPGPGPGASLASREKLGSPTNEESSEAGDVAMSGTAGATRMAATAVATAARASPRPRDRPAINWSAASAATGRRMPGKNATPMASADPIPTTKRKEEPGGSEAATGGDKLSDEQRARRREDRFYADVKAEEMLDLPPDQRFKEILKMSPAEQRGFSNALKGNRRDDFMEGMDSRQRETLMALNNPLVSDNRPRTAG